MQRILEALRQILAGLVNVFSWPAKAFTRLFGLSQRDEDEPEKAAGKAVSVAEKEEAEENRDALLRRQARALQRVLDSRLAGETPSKSALAKLPENVRSYVMSLTDDEVAIAAKAQRSSLIVAIAGQGISGIRTPVEVRQDVAVARRAALGVVESPKLAAGGTALKQTAAARSVDAIFAELAAAEPRRMGM